MLLGTAAALLSLSAQLGALCAVPERLLISTPDEALGRALVRSANQHVTGPVELVARGAVAPPRVLRLVVVREGTDRLRLVLSREPRHSVVQVLKISGQHGPFDLAEAVALLISDLRARLDEQAAAESRLAAVAPAREGALLARPVAPRPLRQQAPEGVRARGPEPPPPPLRAATEPVTEPRIEVREAVVLSELVLPVPDPPAQPVAAAEPPRPPAAPPPELPIRVPLTRAQAAEPSPLLRWRWHLAAGISLEALGLALGGLGAASLALDGQCTDSARLCEYRYDGRTAGAIELALGGTALLAGTGLIVAVAYQHRRLTPRRPGTLLSITAGNARSLTLGGWGF